MEWKKKELEYNTRVGRGEREGERVRTGWREKERGGTGWNGGNKKELKQGGGK